MTRDPVATRILAASAIVTGTSTSTCRRAVTSSTALTNTGKPTSPVAVTSSLTGQIVDVCAFHRHRSGIAGSSTPAKIRSAQNKLAPSSGDRGKLVRLRYLAVSLVLSSVYFQIAGRPLHQLGRHRPRKH